MLNQGKLGLKSICLCLVGLIFSASSYASFVGEKVDIRLYDPLFPFDVTNPDVEVVAGDGVVLDRFDGSLINTTPPGGILEGTSIEFSTIGSNTVTFNLRGDGAAHSEAGYQTTNYGPDAVFVLSGFSKSLLELFEVVDAGLLGVVSENVVGVSLGNELLIDYALNTITLKIGTLGVLDGGDTDIGSITFGVVPIPAALPLMLSGLVLIGFIARRKKA